MSYHDIETTARELQELKRMKEELEAEITSLEDRIKAEMTVRNTEDMDCRSLPYQMDELPVQPLRQHPIQEGSRRPRGNVHESQHQPPLLHQLKRRNIYHSIPANVPQ